MLPIILYSHNENKTEKYLEEFINTRHIRSSNVYRFIPEKSELSMEEVRNILKLFSIRFTTDRVFIFYRFEHTSWEVQNMLLKVLEEKRDSHFIFLITSNLYSLLSTIRSRAKTVTIATDDNLSRNKTFVPPLLYFLTNKNIQNPLFHEQLINLKKEDALIYLDDFIYYFSHQLKEKQRDTFAEILKHIFYIKNKVEKNNLNVSLAMDNLLLFIQKKISINT